MIAPLPVALTGATGFLGSHIAEALLAAGVPVRGVVRSPEKGAWLAEKGMALRRADLTDTDALTSSFAGSSVLIANAALGSNLGTLEDFRRTNVTGTENTLKAAAAAGIRRVIYISSVAVYRNAPGVAITEDHPRYGHRRRLAWSDLTTDWRYSMTKCIAEDRALALSEKLGISLTVLRPGPIYGSRDSRWTQRILRLWRRAFLVLPTVGVPMLHARDVAAAVLACVRQPETGGQAYTLAGPPARLDTIIRTLGALAGRTPRILALPLPLSIRYDTRKAAAALGFAPIPLGDGLREVWENELRPALHALPGP